MLDSKQKTKVYKHMKIAICDDVPAFANNLYGLICDVCAKKDWNTEHKFFVAPQELLASDLGDFQVVFLDIDMPGIDGLNVARKLREQYPEIIIVFVTAWIEYAPQGYRVNAFRYLLKSSIEKEIQECLEDIYQKLYIDNKSIRVSTRECDNLYALKDILYFEGTPRRLVLLHLQNSKISPLECLGKLSDYENQLQDKGFLRIQKSFLVNMFHIEKIRNYTATLKNGTSLRVSEKNYSQICRQFVTWKGQQL